MKTIKKRRILLLTFLLIVMSGFVWAKEPMSNLQGIKPYTPSRLEWLALELNAEMRIDFLMDSNFSMAFVPHEKEDAICIYVRYNPNVNREIMNMEINAARENISRKAKYYGWSSWLKIKEDTALLERFKK